MIVSYYYFYYYLKSVTTRVLFMQLCNPLTPVYDEIFNYKLLKLLLLFFMTLFELLETWFV